MTFLPKTEVLIIGGGIIGTSIARELAKYSAEVTLVEREVDLSFGTTKANSGIVHSGIHDQPGTLKARFCVRGNQLYPVVAAELDVLYKKNGALIVARNHEELRSLELLRKNGLTNGVPEVIQLKKEELLHLEPALSPELAGGLLVPSGGIVVPFDLAYALAENAQANGVRIAVQTEVTKIKDCGAEFLVETDQGRIISEYIVNAAGLSGARVAEMIGDESFKIKPRKGEEYILDKKYEGIIKRTIFPLPTPISKGILVIPTVDGNIMLGPTAQQDMAPDDLATSVAGWNRILQEASTLFPGFNASDLITSFAGLRAVPDGEDFIIGPSRQSHRFINVAGIASPGLTAALGIAEYVVELLKESGLRLRPNRGFNPHRWQIRLRNLGAEERARIIQKDSRYAHIVCRCELVSEGEIRNAIKRGATTVDGIKLRTRAGMGRCQGGFCTPKIIKILSEELQISPAEVSKKGPGSSLLVDRIRQACRADQE